MAQQEYQGPSGTDTVGMPGEDSIYREECRDRVKPAQGVCNSVRAAAKRQGQPFCAPNRSAAFVLPCSSVTFCIHLISLLNTWERVCSGPFSAREGCKLAVCSLLPALSIAAVHVHEHPVSHSQFTSCWVETLRLLDHSAPGLGYVPPWQSLPGRGNLDQERLLFLILACARGGERSRPLPDATAAGSAHRPA